MGEKTSLYRFYDADDNLLYVGISRRPFWRLGEHNRDERMRSVVRVQLDWFDTRELARRAEKVAICMQRPLWNKHDQHNHPSSGTYMAIADDDIGLGDVRLRLPQEDAWIIEKAAHRGDVVFSTDPEYKSLWARVIYV